MKVNGEKAETKENITKKIPKRRIQRNAYEKSIRAVRDMD